MNRTPVEHPMGIVRLANKTACRVRDPLVNAVLRATHAKEHGAGRGRVFRCRMQISGKHRIPAGSDPW